ncbi:MAG: ABC transporter ATP-binding protein [Actinomycetota bacterium]|nr:ABC transporter ATP-binding protein [Actinomycetota bacterium]
MSVAVHGVRKTYPAARRHHRTGPVEALGGVDLEIADGELLVVVGPSGSGKTTLLRTVAGLEHPDEGRVEVGGVDVTELSPGARDVAMVFQEYALYPHMSVRANIAFGLHARGTPRAEIADHVGRAATMLRLGDVLERRPAELSGGERQRVALARAVVRSPRAFLMDEPLSNLDAELRAQTRTEIKALQQKLGTTTMYVTHDQVEAMTMGSRVAVMRAGRIEQVGPPMELYERPASSFVARFMGTPPMNVFPAALLVGRGVDGAVTVGIRPERLDVVAGQRGGLNGNVVAVERVGSESIVHVDVAGQRLLARAEPHAPVDPGDEVGLDFEDRSLHRFDAAGIRLPE